MSDNDTLQILNLERTGLGDEGVQMIALVLSQNSALLELSLVDNSFGDAGALALAEALGVSSSLRVLLCNENKQTTAAVSSQLALVVGTVATLREFGGPRENRK